jgi:hypothetical protein
MVSGRRGFDSRSEGTRSKEKEEKREGWDRTDILEDGGTVSRWGMVMWGSFVLFLVSASFRSVSLLAIFNTFLPSIATRVIVWQDK